MIAAYSQRLLAIFVLLLSSIIVNGCFNYDAHLILTRSGEGELSFYLTLFEKLTTGYHASQLNNIIFPNPSHEIKKKDGILIIKESCHFSFLDELITRQIRFEIKVIDTGLLGITDYAYRITAYIKMRIEEDDLPNRNIYTDKKLAMCPFEIEKNDPAETTACQLIAQTLNNYYFSLRICIPGKVYLSQPINLNINRIDPKINSDGNQIEWKIPLSILVNEKLGEPLIFLCDFKGDFKFRSYMQKEIHSYCTSFLDKKIVNNKNINEELIQK